MINNNSLIKFLLHKTKVGDFVIIRDSGWYIGCTIIDHEDLFEGSLNQKILLREVKNVAYSTWPIHGVAVKAIIVDV